MKRVITASLMVAIGAGLALSQKPASASEELKQLEMKWMGSQKSRDTAKLEDILSDSWTGVDSGGKTSDKAAYLADLKSPVSSVASSEMGPMTVRFFGNTAVVTGSTIEKRADNGKDSSGKYVWTDVFVKRKGKWKAVVSQTARVPN